MLHDFQSGIQHLDHILSFHKHLCILELHFLEHILHLLDSHHLSYTPQFFHNRLCKDHLQVLLSMYI
jgi:hypothetical protein